MNNWNGSIGRIREQGLVLPLALVLLLVLTVAGVASLRGTTMQERMAVGQIQMHSSFLDSESLVWAAASCIRDQYIDGEGKFISPLPDTSAVISLCGEADLADLNDGAVIIWDESVQPWRYHVIAARAFEQTGAITPVVLEVFTPGSLGGNNPPPGLPKLSPYACFGSNCAFTTAQSAASPSADGRNRLPPDIGEMCNTQGNKRPAVDSANSGSVPGVIIPDGEIIKTGSVKSGASTGIEGSPPTIETPGAWETWNENQDPESRIAFPEDYIKELITDLTVGLGDNGGQDIQLTHGQEGVFVAGPGDVITIDGGNSAAFGVIILNGGTLRMDGRQCFVGSVIFGNGGRVESLSGSPATVGSVIGFAPGGENDPIINPFMGGNPSYYYSDRAMEIASDILGRALGPGYIFEIARWRAPIRLDLSVFNFE